MATLSVPPRTIIRYAARPARPGRRVFRPPHALRPAGGEPEPAVPAERADTAGQIGPPLPAPSCHQRVKLPHVAGG